MASKSLGNPFDGDTKLTHTQSCQCESCKAEISLGPDNSDYQRQDALEKQIEMSESQQHQHHSKKPSEQFETSDDLMDRAVESAIVRGVFGHSDPSRRDFIKLVGGGTFAAALGSILPLDKIKAAVKDSIGPLEKTKLKVGFVPITCATPIIMAQPMGFYAKYGLDVDVIKTAGWAVARDKSLNGEYDASHMLTPMPLAMSMGAGSTATPYISRP